MDTELGEELDPCYQVTARDEQSDLVKNVSLSTSREGTTDLVRYVRIVPKYNAGEQRHKSVKTKFGHRCRMRNFCD
ncbi:hypothetical protein ACFPFP_41610 [Bradyrhizobium sp. GCM10023182]|uniref:Uncharacterized protein n=1 Tax=Bradyrhizobium zhengyangense TaxID=2911009 RepID=A0ABS9M248_9BRAD|nr:hypothetical protein [Bradyrhizobium zhengyangense]MCG2673340.1 hypothetical protein [Bradyrhizobium zhengyangense]